MKFYEIKNYVQQLFGKRPKATLSDKKVDRKSEVDQNVEIIAK